MFTAFTWGFVAAFVVPPAVAVVMMLVALFTPRRTHSRRVGTPAGTHQRIAA
jgi:hypothetical protein